MSEVPVPRPEYVVLSEGASMHLVAIRYGTRLPWLRVVAAFPSKDRADSYAEVENEFVGDKDPNWPDDLKYDTPKVEELASSLPKALERLRDQPAPPVLPAVEAPKQEAITPPPKEDQHTVEHRAADSADKAASLREKVRALWPNKSVAEIAIACGVTDARIYQIKKELGLPSRTGSGAEVVPSATKPIKVSPPPPPPLPVSVKSVAAPSGNAVHMNDVTLDLDEETIARGAEIVDLTTTQTAALAVLMRAAPNPVGLPFILKKIYGSLAATEAELRFSVVERDLRRNLQPLRLDLRSMKGVGLSLAVAQ